MKTAIITTKGGNVIRTLFNKECTDKDIIDHYNDNNFFSSLNEDHVIDDQVVNITIVLTGRDTGHVGRSLRHVEYDFKFNDYAKCYLY